MTEKKWYLFAASDRVSNRIEFGCRKLGIEVLSPQVTDFRKCKRTRRRKPFTQPAFKGYYIFGYPVFNPFPLKRVIEIHDSVRPILMSGRDKRTGEETICLGRVSASDIKAIQEDRMFTKSDAKSMLDDLQPDTEFKTGDLVRILGGSMTGLKGSVVRAHPLARQVVMEFTNGPFRGATVPYEYLEADEDDKAA
ncbi:MAG: hypothetical protein AAFP81_19660 [Pseudomonadota bacterium]